MKKTFKSSSFRKISNFYNGLFKIHQTFKGHFLNELRVSFNCTSNQKVTLITFFIWPRETLEIIFKVKS